jgi:hypothetical protein
MQQPIRYYITKSGEEPTVRSVKVAREVPVPESRDDAATQREVERTVEGQQEATPRESVTHFVRGAIRRRMLFH